MKKIFSKENVTIPNILSLFRILLAFVFWYLYDREGLDHRTLLLAVTLGLSALTDLLDGKIARRFHMVSELGKILDPMADKITQGVLLICLLGAYPLIKYLLLLFLVKEEYILTVGTKAVLSSGKNDGAKWYGKVNTAVFYAVMVILVLFPSISSGLANLLIMVSGAFMCLALVLYARQYRHIMGMGHRG